MIGTAALLELPNMPLGADALWPNRRVLLQSADVSSFRSLLIYYSPLGGTASTDTHNLAILGNYGTAEVPPLGQGPLWSGISGGFAPYTIELVHGWTLRHVQPVTFPRFTLSVSASVAGTSLACAVFATTAQLEPADLNPFPLVANATTVAASTTATVDIPPYVGPADLYVRPTLGGGHTGGYISNDDQPLELNSAAGSQLYVAGYSESAVTPPFVVPITLWPGRNRLQLVNQGATQAIYYAITPRRGR